MALFHFHFVSSRDRIVDRRGAHLADPNEAHNHALRLIVDAVSAVFDEPWGSWAIEVTDEADQHVITLPFRMTIAWLSRNRVEGLRARAHVSESARGTVRTTRGQRR